MTATRLKTTEVWAVDGMTLSNVHAEGTCQGDHCVLHNPSDHTMRNWPLRADYVGAYMMMYRVCEHGAWHEDPDSRAYVEAMIEDDLPENPDCDGCCS